MYKMSHFLVIIVNYVLAIKRIKGIAVPDCVFHYHNVTISVRWAYGAVQTRMSCLPTSLINLLLVTAISKCVYLCSC